MSATPPLHPSGPADPQTPLVSVPQGWLAGPSVFGSHDQHQAKRAFGATLATVGLHGLFLLVALLLFTYRDELQEAVVPPEPMRFVYLQQPGPGGGGGGSPAPAPPKPISIPKTKPLAPTPVAPPPPTVTPPPPIPTLAAPVMTTNSDLVQATGISSVSLATYGGGGRGTGVGTGTGSGVGPGTGGGFGGGAYKPGSGIQNPVPLVMPKPAYTSEAMRAKIQGTVTLEAVVDESGTVSDVRVMKSLDRLYGLDQEAMKAARKWLFRPARDRENKAVPIIVVLELDFRLH